MKPMILLLNGVANRTLLALGIEPQEELSAARSPAELASLVRSSAEAGTLDRSTARLVTASLGFADQTAADVMTPRSRATSIERTATAADVVAAGAAHRALALPGRRGRLGRHRRHRARQEGDRRAVRPAHATCRCRR